MAVTLTQGDCLEVMREMPSASVDAVITDPPYLLGASSARVSADKVRPWASDIENASFWYAEWYGQVWRLLKDTGCFWTFCNWHSLAVAQCAAARSAMRVTSVLVWDKQWPGVGSQKGLRQNYELVALMAKPEFAIANRSIPDIWQCKWASQRPSGHPAEKPVPLVERIIKTSDLPVGGIVLDPFCGSGSTGVAAIYSGCHFIGIEREAHYLDIARLRLAAANALSKLDLGDVA